jgi:hypothetical protein
VLSPAPKILAFVLDDIRVQLAATPAIVPSFDTLVWQGGAASNYDTLLSYALADAGAGIVVPFASPDVLFADQPRGPLPNGPSVTRRYFHAGDDAGTGPWACAHRAVDAAIAGGVVAPTCAVPPPWTTDAPLPACTTPPSTTVSPSSFMCGDADDLAVALGGTTPTATWLTRWEATPAVETSTPLALDDAHAGALPAFHEAQTAQQGACGGGSTGTTTPPTGQPNGGGNPYGSNDPNGGSGTEDDYATTHSGCDATFGCATRSSSSGSDGCDSSSGGSSNDGCSSSSDGGSSGDGCGKSSGSSSDDGCGKGSGGGSSSDNGCGGGSSSGGSGGGCGGGGGGADNGCSVASPKARIRATPFGYLAVALAVLARRATRRR